MFQFLLTVLVLILGMFSGYMYNELKFLKTDVENLEQKFAEVEAVNSADRVESQAIEFLSEFNNDELAESQIVEPELTPEPELPKETIEIKEGFLKGFLDLERFSVEQNAMDLALKFFAESPTIESLIASGTGGITKVSENNYKLSLGCINNAGLVKSQVFTLSVEDTKTLLSGKANNLRLFFSPKVGFVGKSCQSPLSLIQIID